MILGGRQISVGCALDAEAAELLETAMDRLSLCARACDRILKVARTIADLELPNESCRVAHLLGLLAGGGLTRGRPWGALTS